MTEQEQIVGRPVDLACLRRYPAGHYVERARRHSTECALMGHCIESGYGLVQDDGNIVPLDTEATSKVVDALRQPGKNHGVRLHARRELHDGEMVTEAVERAT